MKTDEIYRGMANKLYPDLYSERHDFDNGLLFSKPAPFGLGARYALCICPRKVNQTLFEQLQSLRTKVDKQLNAMWFFREVGLYVTILGPESTWASESVHIHADVTGFHAVILQKVQCVDIDTGKCFSTQSHWGPVKFGTSADISEMIKQITAEDVC